MTQLIIGARDFRARVSNPKTTARLDLKVLFEGFRSPRAWPVLSRLTSQRLDTRPIRKGANRKLSRVRARLIIVFNGRVPPPDKGRSSKSLTRDPQCRADAGMSFWTKQARLSGFEAFQEHFEVETRRGSGIRDPCSEISSSEFARTD